MEPLQKQNESWSHQKSKLVLMVMSFDLRNLWCFTYQNMLDLLTTLVPHKEYDSHLLA